MNIRTKLLLTMILMIALPLSVTIVTWRGLVHMDRDIQRVAEEFAEARSLQRMDRDLGVAILALQQESDEFGEHALEHLTDAKNALLKYLVSQYGSEATEEHQAEESEHAYAVLTDLDALIGTEWATMSPADRTGRAEMIREGILVLYRDADAGVVSAQQSAEDAQRQTLRLVLAVTVASALSCIVLSVWSTRGVVGRLNELHRSIVTRAEGRSQARPRDVTEAMDQIDELSEQMSVRIREKNRELLRKERMAGIGLLAADVAHEINNPMNAVLGLTELSLRTTGRGDIDDESRHELHESLTVIRREVCRCKEIVERLMAMVRSRCEPHWFDANQLLNETVQVARASRPDKATCFHVLRPSQPLRVFAPSQEVRQIVLTMLVNAADAVSSDGRIEVDATQSDDEVWLRVRDDGRGFTPDMQADFPIALETTRAQDGGVGLGLSIAYALALDIGAEIRSFSDGPDRGSLFMLAIPNMADEP